jgi:hypothetical protein
VIIETGRHDMKHLLFPPALAMSVFLVMFVLGGCEQENPPAESQDHQKAAAKRDSKQASAPTTSESSPPTSQDSDPKGVGETTEVGAFLVTLNDAKPYSSGENKDEEADAQGHYYAVVDLTLENNSQESLDASGPDYLLRDEEGYSFETTSLSEQKPEPEGQLMPGGKASGQVAFDLGKEVLKGPLTLSVSLSEQPDVPPATFEFEVNLKEKTSETSSNGAQKEARSKPQDSTAEENLVTKPNYKVLEDPSGSLTVEVPLDWEAETGADSEGAGGPNSWSYYAGEYMTSSITTAHSLYNWKYGGAPTSGTYIVASKKLAQTYTDDELIHSLLFAHKADKCTAGPYEDFARPPYSGKIQTWYDCGLNDNTSFVVAAASEGRECVVVLDAITASTADSEAVQHILDSFEVNCEALPTPTPLDASATASPSASPESSTSASARPNTSSSPCPNTRITPDGVQCSDLPDVIPGSPDPNHNPSSSPPDSHPSSGGDINCDEVDGPIPTPPGDPNNLDGDGDGLACE